MVSLSNGFIESFHNRLHDKCLKRGVLLGVAEAQGVIEQWRHSYNNEHPHSRLGLEGLCLAMTVIRMEHLMV